MKRNKPAFYLRTIVVTSLLLTFVDNSSYAAPSLPNVAGHETFSIEVYPMRHRLVVQMNGQTIEEYTVSVGNPSTPTPVGEYQIIYKGKNWGSSFGPRWLGLN